MKTSLYCLPPFFKFCPTTSHPHVAVTSNSHPNCSFCCPVSLAEWVITPHVMCYLLNDDMDIHLSSYGTLVPEGPWCVFYATRLQGYWGLTHIKVFYWYSDLISHTQTHKHTAHSGTSRMTHPYKYTFTPPVMWSQQLPFTDLKNLLSTMSLLLIMIEMV